MPEIGTPQELFAYKVGTALAAERKVLTMLGMMEEKAQLDELRQQFAHHRQETEGQIRNLEQALEALGTDGTAHQDATMDGIAEQAEKLLGRVDESLTDAVLLGGAAHTEHHEIATYEGLIAMAQAMGEDDVVALLQENLEQEQHTLQEVERATQTLSQGLAQMQKA